MRNDFCTGYLEHSAKGKTWTSHKYVAKAKLANGLYKYFYSLAEYQAFLKGKGVKSGGQIPEKDYQSSGKTQSDNAKKANVANGKKVTSKQLEDAKKKIAETRNKLNEDKKKKSSSASAEVKAAESDDKSKKKSGSSSSSKKSGSKKSSGGKKSSSSKSKDKEKKEKENKEKQSSSSGSKKTAEKKETTKTAEQTTAKQTQQETTAKTSPSLSSYKYQYDLKDEDINTYSGAETDRVSTNRVAEILDDMVDKYPDNSSGYLLSSFSDSITYQFKWVKEGGTIKLLDPDTGTEVSADTSLTNAKSVSLFRTDNKVKKS